MLPTTTPREVLYMETGMNHRMTKRINIHCRVQNTSNETLQAFMNLKNDKAWINETLKLEESIGIPNIPNETKEQKRK